METTRWREPAGRFPERHLPLRGNPRRQSIGLSGPRPPSDPSGPPVRGRSGRGSSPWSRRRRSPRRTSAAHRRCRRLPRWPGAGHVDSTHGCGCVAPRQVFGLRAPPTNAFENHSGHHAQDVTPRPAAGCRIERRHDERKRLLRPRGSRVRRRGRQSACFATESLKSLIVSFVLSTEQFLRFRGIDPVRNVQAKPLGEVLLERYPLSFVLHRFGPGANAK